MFAFIRWNRSLNLIEIKKKTWITIKYKEYKKWVISITELKVILIIINNELREFLITE